MDERVRIWERVNGGSDDLAREEFHWQEEGEFVSSLAVEHPFGSNDILTSLLFLFSTRLFSRVLSSLTSPPSLQSPLRLSPFLSLSTRATTLSTILSLQPNQSMLQLRSLLQPSRSRTPSLAKPSLPSLLFTRSRPIPRNRPTESTSDQEVDILSSLSSEWDQEEEEEYQRRPTRRSQTPTPPVPRSTTDTSP